MICIVQMRLLGILDKLPKLVNRRTLSQLRAGRPEEIAERVLAAKNSHSLKLSISISD